MRRTLGAAAVVLAAVLAGCGTSTPLVPSDPATPRDGGELSVYGCAPAQALIPGDAVDTCGVRLMDAVHDRLVRYRGERGEAELNLASEITSSDARNFNVRLVPGRTFHDGTEIKARNFIDAWNWNASGVQGYQGASYFSMIQGAAAMACRETASCGRGGQPAKMTGLRLVDDYTFTIALTRPIPDFADRLGHPAYAPYPDSFFAPAATASPQQQRVPTGSGPFRIESVWPGEIALRRVDTYPAEQRPHVDRVVFRSYDDRGRVLDDAYQDVVAGRLDYTDVIPTDNLYDDQWKEQLRERWRQTTTPRLETLTFATDDRQLRNPKLRSAISRAIDRQALTRQVFNGTRVPATGWVPQGVGDYPGDACGQLCVTDVLGARKAYQDAGGYAGQFFVTVNGDGGHKQWADALCNQLKVNLGMNCQVRVVANHAEIMRLLESEELTGVYRQDWSVAYASPETFLEAYLDDAYASGGYRNDDFEKKLYAAEAAGSGQQAPDGYQAAEAALVANPPAIPLWTASTPIAWSTRVRGLALTPQGSIDLNTAWIG